MRGSARIVVLQSLWSKELLNVSISERRLELVELASVVHTHTHEQTHKEDL